MNRPSITIISTIILATVAPSSLDASTIGRKARAAAATPLAAASPATAATDCCKGNCDNYRGTVSKTKEGKSCKRWDLKSWKRRSGFKFEENPTTFPNAGLEANYCRNPLPALAHIESAWCFTEAGRWGHCDVPKCEDEGDLN